MRVFILLLVVLLAGCQLTRGGEQISQQERGIYKGEWLTDAGDVLSVQGMFTGDGQLLLASFRDGANVPADVVFANVTQQGGYVEAQGLDFNGRRVLDFSMSGNFVGGWQLRAEYLLGDQFVGETGVLHLDHVREAEVPAAALAGEWSNGFLRLQAYAGRVTAHSQTNPACYYPEGYLDADASGRALFSGRLVGVGCAAGAPELALHYRALAYVDGNGVCGRGEDTLVLGFYSGEDVHFHELCRL